MKIQTKLNLGCGRNKEKLLPYPWLNIDMSSEAAEINCDIRCLPVDWKERFDEVRASHVLEHFFPEELDNILTEWLRVLKPGGKLMIIVPDLDIIIQSLISGVDPRGRTALSITETTPVLSQIYGVGYESRLTEDAWRHRLIFTKNLLEDLLSRQELLGDISVYSSGEDPAALFGIKDDSQNCFSLCIHAYKKM